MDKYVELEFLNRLNLEKVIRKPNGFNFRCPICHDSAKSQSKRRGWIHTEKQYLTFNCYNCGSYLTFRAFLKKVNPILFIEYLEREKEEKLKDLKNGTLFKKHQELTYKTDININTIKYQFQLNPKYFQPAKNYEKAVRFCNERKIQDNINSIYYCIHPNSPCSGMVIFPFLMPDGKTLFGFVGRHVDYKKFHIHSTNLGFKIFNLFGVNQEEKVFIFESIIDSYCLDNSVACAGADINENLLNLIKQPIMIPDNDFRGMQTAIKYMEKGYKCFIYPDNFHYKDFNEAYCKGVSKTDLYKMVLQNIFEGNLGIMKMKFRMMTRKS